MSVPLVGVWRGQLLESLHRGDVVVSDPDGRVVAALGDPDKVTYWRSAAKPVQVLPLVAAGGMERFGFSDAELALMCASHSGEPYHVEAVRSILAKIGLSEAHLRCGAHPPLHEASARALWRAGQEPQPIHANCSGKHAGMLASAVLFGDDPQGYLDPDHPVQRRIRATVAQLAGLPPTELVLATDGCGVPVFGLPLRAMARAYARLARPDALPAPLDAAARRVVKAMQAHPEMVAGTGRFCTALNRVGRPYLFAKGGAEGVYCLGHLPSGLGLALKIEDGNGRATSPAVVEALDRLGWLASAQVAELASHHQPAVVNHAGDVVGRMAPLEVWEHLAGQGSPGS